MVFAGGMKNSTKGAAFGLTAGLVGGSLAGMVLGVPGISSASASTAVAVQQSDEPVDDAPVERGEMLREVLQALVDDGTLTADQADAVTTHLVENRPERGNRGDRVGRGHGDRGGRGPGGFDRSGVLTELLGLDSEALRTELRSGSTLAEIAEAQGVEASAVVDALVAQATERMNAAVESERLTADEAAEKLAELETRIADRVNGD